MNESYYEDSNINEDIDIVGGMDEEEQTRNVTQNFTQKMNRMVEINKDANREDIPGEDEEEINEKIRGIMALIRKGVSSSTISWLITLTSSRKLIRRVLSKSLFTMSPQESRIKSWKMDTPLMMKTGGISLNCLTPMSRSLDSELTISKWLWIRFLPSLRILMLKKQMM